MKEIPQKRRIRPWRVAAIILASLVGLVVIGVVALTLWLTPRRIARLASEAVCENLDARLEVDEIRYSIWSTFPRLTVETDTLCLLSTALHGKTFDAGEKLPQWSDTLLCLSHFRGSVNIADLLHDVVRLGDVSVEGLKTNILMVDDSVANYNILRGRKVEMPSVDDISVSLINIAPGARLRFMDMRKGAEGTLSLQRLMLAKTDRRMTYRVSLLGNAAMRIAGNDYKRGIALNGDITPSPGFKGVAIDNFTISSDGIAATLGMGVNFADAPEITRFRLEVAPVEIHDLIASLPENMVKLPKGLSAGGRLSLKARLSGSYTLSGGKLPVVEAEVSLDSCAMNYAYLPGKRIKADNILLTGHIGLDGGEADSFEVSLSDVRISGEGDFIAGGISVEDATFEGLLSGNIPVRKGLSADSLRLSDVKFTGKMGVKSAGGAANGMRIAGSGLAMDFDVAARELGSDGLKEATMLMQIALGHARVNTPQGEAALRGLNVSLGMPRKTTLGFGGSLSTLPDVTADVRVASAGYASGDTIAVKGRNAAISMSVEGSRGKAVAKVADLDFRVPDVAMAVEGIEVGLGAGSSSGGQQMYQPATAGVQKDARTLQFAPHTPLYVSPGNGGILSDLIQSMTFTLGVKVRKGSLRAEAFPALNTFEDMDMYLDNDSLRVRNLYAHSGGCGVVARGDVTNLGQFFAEGAPSPLKMRMHLAIDTLDINRLSRIYENGVALREGIAATLPVAKPKTVSRSDSTALLVPRNLDATAHITANHLIYTDLDLTDVSTTLAMQRGEARIDSLSLTSPFGKAVVDVRYSTADMQDIYLAGNVEASNLDIERFFDCYRNTLLARMPYMSNFSGVVDLSAKGKILLFPSMFFNVPSLAADFSVTGDGLTVRQNKFIRRITRMMLIRNSGDIVIPDFTVKAAITQNLIELYPFEIDIDRYRLNMAGVNNFNGEMYYHLGIMKSPVPFPFGINIKGDMSSPLLRFGGADFKSSEGETVTPHILEDERRVNLLLNLKYGFSEFIKKAAYDDNSSDTDYVYPVMIAPVSRRHGADTAEAR